MIDASGRPIRLEIDGGVKPTTSPRSRARVRHLRRRQSIFGKRGTGRGAVCRRGRINGGRCRPLTPENAGRGASAILTSRRTGLKRRKPAPRRGGDAGFGENSGVLPIHRPLQWPPIFRIDRDDGVTSARPAFGASVSCAHADPDAAPPPWSPQRAKLVGDDTGPFRGGGARRPATGSTCASPGKRAMPSATWPKPSQAGSRRWSRAATVRSAKSRPRLAHRARLRRATDARPAAARQWPTFRPPPPAIPDAPRAACAWRGPAAPIDLLRLEAGGTLHWAANPATGGFGTGSPPRPRRPEVVGRAGLRAVGLSSLGASNRRAVRLRGPGSMGRRLHRARHRQRAPGPVAGRRRARRRWSATGLLDVTLVPPLDGEVLGHASAPRWLRARTRRWSGSRCVARCRGSACIRPPPGSNLDGEPVDAARGLHRLRAGAGACMHLPADARRTDAATVRP